MAKPGSTPGCEQRPPPRTVLPSTESCTGSGPVLGRWGWNHQTLPATFKDFSQTFTGSVLCSKPFITVPTAPSPDGLSFFKIYLFRLCPLKTKI